MSRLNPALDGVDLPSRIAALPVGPNGFPVPWFVAWVDGRPEFRAMDHRKFVAAVRERRCWVCGEPLARFMTFVAGPMCGINRTSAEPPSHTECARFSARYCPFLARPRMTRREGGLDELGAIDAPGLAIKRNPGVTLLWTTRQYRPFGDGQGGVLIRMGDPEAVEWWREGRPATRAEVEESVRTGLPALEAVADDQPDARAALAEMAADFERYYPAAGGTPP